MADYARLMPRLAEQDVTVIVLGTASILTLLFVIIALAVTLVIPNFEMPFSNLIARSVLTGFGILVLIRQVILVSLSVAGRIKARRTRHGPPMAHWPLVSILVPAYNEAENISESLSSLLQQDYPNFEIIVIDDGSKDNTLALALEFKKNHDHRRPITVISKPNAGKASAQNQGFSQSSGELVLVMDADSRIERMALRRMVPSFLNPEIDGVAGQVSIRFDENLITRMQAIEYAIANGTTRTAQSLWNCVLLVPGPIGLFRRQALEKVALALCEQTLSITGEDDTRHGTDPLIAPISAATFAEDFETSVRVIANGGGIAYEPEAVCYTRPPANVIALVNQRYRWVRGHLQVGDLFLNRLRRQGGGKLNGWMCFTCLFDIYLMPFATIVMFAMALTGFMITENIGLWAVAIASTFFAFSTILMYCIASQRVAWRLLLVAPAFVFYQIFVLSGAFLIAFYDHLRSAKMRW